MRTKKLILVLSVIVAAEFVVMAGICIRDVNIQHKPDKPDVIVREVGPQAVLYTVYRGPYENICKAINKLYNLALVKGMLPCGPISTGYLNNPLTVSPEHWLIEIRLPVDAEALEYAGKLGGMTDVKSLPAMKFAVAVKPQGQTNPEPVISGLFSWINQKGYVTVGRMWQSVLINETGDYVKMKTEFMVPVKSRMAATDSNVVFHCAELI